MRRTVGAWRGRACGQDRVQLVMAARGADGAHGADRARADGAHGQTAHGADRARADGAHGGGGRPRTGQTAHGTHRADDAHGADGVHRALGVERKTRGEGR